MVASACQSDGEIRVESLYLLGEICNNDESVSSCIYFFIQIVADNLQQIVGMLSASLTSGNYAFQIQACRVFLDDYLDYRLL